MATDRDNQRISDEAYEVDHNKNDSPWEKGDILSDFKLSTDYQILKVEDNKITECKQ